MKTSESREQQIFLVTGGIILILILGVVGLDVIEQFDEAKVVADTVSSPPSPSPPAVTVAVPEKPSGEKKPWIEAVKVAQVFQSVDKLPPIEPLPEKEKENTINPLKDLPSLPIVEEEKNAVPVAVVPPLSAWHPNAGELEAARLVPLEEEEVVQSSVDIPKEPKEEALLLADDGVENETFPDKMDTAEPIHEDKVLSSVALDVSRLKTLATMASPMLKLSPVLTHIPDVPQDGALIARPLPVSVGKLSAAPIDTETAIEDPLSQDLSHLGYWVRLASFSDEKNALGLLKSLGEIMSEGGPLPVSKSDSTVADKIYYRVQMGPFADYAQAAQAARIVRHHTDINGIIISPRK